MFGWLKKRDDKKIEELESSVKNSFQNMRTDMNQVSQWIGHFKTKHEEHHTRIQEHHTKIEDLNNKLVALEEMLAIKSAVLNPETSKVRVQEPQKEIIELNKSFEENINFKNEIKLTESQQRLYDTLSSLVRENPERWISMKNLAADAYSKKTYDKSHSVISQYLSLFEMYGLVQRKRVGKETFITMVRDLEGKPFNVLPQKKIIKKSH